MRSYTHHWRAAVALTGCLLASSSQAQIVMDGTVDATYGMAKSIQNTNTHFGNNINPDPIINSGGSEIDGVYATVANGRLYVTIAGNLEANFNKMEVYIDSKGGGINTVTGPSLVKQVDGYCCNLNGNDPPNLPDPNNGALQRQNGLTFDTGFEADYYLTFSRGGESAGPSFGYAEGTNFYAMTAHYADLQAGTQQALGMQVGPQGLPNTLRVQYGTDFDGNKKVDGNDFLRWQRGLNQFDGTTTLATKADGDSNNDKLVNATDLANWRADFGRSPGLADFAFSPYNGGPSTAELLGPAFPGLTQGQLIDKAYATTTGTSGGQLLARELAFVLPVDTINDPDNILNRRDMLNTVGLEMAYDDSNIAGVSDAGPYPTATTENTGAVKTGLEFSIPLSQIGNPTGAIKLFAFVNSGGHNYASNQFSGTGILDSRLGGNGFGGDAPNGDLAGVNMNDFDGDQYVTIANPAVPVAAGVPEPGCLALLATAALGLAATRRRRSER